MKNEPKIRIKGFEGEWKKLPFSEAFTFLRNNSLSRAQLNYKGGFVKNVHYGDVLIKFGEIIDINKESLPFISDNEISKRFIPNAILNEGDIIFSDAAEDETVGKCSELLNVGKNMIVSGLHTIPCRPIIEFANCFLGFYLNSKAYHNQLLPLIQGTKISSLSKTAFLNTNVTYPSNISEQRAIATYFHHLDSLIETADKKLASLKQVKEASLQTMFPQEGQSVPKVRFKGFEGEWKTDELGNLFSERVESDVHAEMLSVTLTQGIIKANENGRYDNSNNDKSKYRLVKVGDIAYNTMRMWQGASGYSPYYGIVSPAYTVVVPNNDVDSLLFSYLFKTANMIKQFRLHSQGLTTDTWNLKYPAFSKIEITYPTDLSEQHKLASFFLHLDRQIELAQQRLELLRRIKSACLDEMFV